ncbi:MAG: desaturase [Altererythrobacter sp.]|nr:desaturase [Erythrobacter sp.]MAW90544.1 desaturase [Altererythrobacter sp.]MBK63781.1 desaturase [Altererythrobacter sp.]|tara:strand:+ start:327 stop:1064 length:738 start_codon:yes stop_codon:yes gene_type:complete
MLIAAVVFSVAIVMMLIELVAPGRPWVSVRGWWLRALLLNGFQVAMVFVAGITWDVWLDGISLFDSQALFGFYGSVAFGYLTVTFIYYWWHRARHALPFLWRWFHQLHHSPQRLEIITSFYKHPVEIAANSVLSSLIIYVLCGLRPEAGVLVVLITGLAELFYHWNVRTPYWLGFVFQRPESHCIHHGKNWHSQNYSDLPVWDMLFGTFHNPRNFEGECGFAESHELRLGDMLLGRDVHRSEHNR